MRSAGELCNREVIVAKPGTGIREAARLMRSHHVGDLVLVEARAGGNVPVGLVTDRDLVVEVLAAGVDPAGLTLGDLVTTATVTVTEDAGLPELLEVMRSRGIRRLPVVDAGGVLLGIITLDDLLDAFAEGLGELAGMVRAGISHEARTRP
jgi:CBS domain-containing protein